VETLLTIAPCSGTVHISRRSYYSTLKHDHCSRVPFGVKSFAWSIVLMGSFETLKTRKADTAYAQTDVVVYDTSRERKLTSALFARSAIPPTHPIRLFGIYKPGNDGTIQLQRLYRVYTGGKKKFTFASTINIYYIVAFAAAEVRRLRSQIFWMCFGMTFGFRYNDAPGTVVGHGDVSPSLDDLGRIPTMLVGIGFCHLILRYGIFGML